MRARASEASADKMLNDYRSKARSGSIARSASPERQQEGRADASPSQSRPTPEEVDSIRGARAEGTPGRSGNSPPRTASTGCPGEQGSGGGGREGEDEQEDDSRLPVCLRQQPGSSSQGILAQFKTASSPWPSLASPPQHVAGPTPCGPKPKVQEYFKRLVKRRGKS